MIGVLNAYLFDEENHPFQKTYTPICRDFLQKTFPQETIFFYDIAKNIWPKSPSECRGWIITGSAKSAYDDDPWIKKLISFVKDCHSQNSPLIGICFGHQVIAKALGGKVEKSEKGWGLGVREFNIVEKNFPTWMSKTQKASLLFSHQDQVTKLPPNSTLLAEDNFCPNQMYKVGDTILSVQGHPEFTPEFSGMRLEMVKEKLPVAVYQKAKKSLADNRSTEQFSQWFREFIPQTNDG